jgi:hypothetical protein
VDCSKTQRTSPMLNHWRCFDYPRIINPTQSSDRRLRVTMTNINRQFTSTSMTDEIPTDYDSNDNDNSIAPGDELAAMTTDDVSALLTSSRDTHGDAVENQQHIATAWEWYLDGQSKLASDESITGSDVAMLMGLLKMSRNAVGEFDVDHFRDIAGYAAIGAACAVDNDDFDAERDDLAEYHDPTQVTRSENTDAHH